MLIWGLHQTDIFSIYLAFVECPLHTGYWLSGLHVTSFNHHNSERHGRWTMDYSQPHFPGRDTEAQRDEGGRPGHGAITLHRPASKSVHTPTKQAAVHLWCICSALSHWGPRGAHLEVTRGLRASPAQMSPGSKNSDKFPPYSDLRQQSFLFSLALRFPRRIICVQPSKMVHPRRAKKDLMPESPAPHSPLIFTPAGSEHERTIRREVPNWLDSLRCLRAKAEEINKE